MNSNVFTKCMIALQGVFGKIDDSKTKLYFSVLSSMSDSDFESATKKLITTFKPTSTVPFPVPAHFMDASGNTATTKAQDYMALLQKAIYSVGSYRSVDFGCPELHGVIERYGGWVEICKWTQKEWDINENRFTRALEIALEHNDKGSDYLRGIVETENSNQKYSQLTHVKRSKNGEIFIARGKHPDTVIRQIKNVEANNGVFCKLVEKMDIRLGAKNETTND